MLYSEDILDSTYGRSITLTLFWRMVFDKQESGTHAPEEVQRFSDGNHNVIVPLIQRMGLKH